VSAHGTSGSGTPRRRVGVPGVTPEPVSGGTRGGFRTVDSFDLPDDDYGRTIKRRASQSMGVGSGMPTTRPGGRICSRVVILSMTLATVTGCATAERERGNAPARARQVVVVAPVLNLSGAGGVDTLKLTDVFASEILASWPGISVVPVNIGLAAMARRGQAVVADESSALALARELGADATVVVAITEYDPYSPPVVGMLCQWYAVPQQHDQMPRVNPVLASREAEGSEPAALASEEAAPGPWFQVQRVFNAADDAILKEVREFARRRGGHQSPYGWNRYTKSQELYVRYCCWSLIRSMQRLGETGLSDVTLAEAQP